MHDMMGDSAQSRSQEKAQFSKDNQHCDGDTGKQPEDGHPYGSQKYPESGGDDERRKDRGKHCAPERAHQITPDESGDQSIDTRDKEKCERENHHPYRPYDNAGMVIQRRSCRSLFY